jgi:proline dehydrogenase
MRALIWGLLFFCPRFVKTNSSLSAFSGQQEHSQLMAFLPFFAKRWVSGLNSAQAMACVAKLNEKNVSATLDLLGENITSREQASVCTKEYLQLLEDVAARKLNSHVSVKLTMLGLDIDEGFCFEQLCLLLARADALGNRVALDMEGTAYTERTLAMYEKAAQTYRSPEIVLQAYLKRTVADAERVMSANGRFRLCKGAYKEPAHLAYQDMKDIQSQYLKIAKAVLGKATRLAIATHDDFLIEELMKHIRENNIKKECYEFQMLYGMREKTWYKIASLGHNFTVYVPYGEHWQAYYSRRLAERKENVFFVLKNLFRD